MAILTAQAKLYTGIRCLCVDKNISAALSASFSVGNKDIDFPADVPVLDANGRDTIYPNIYNWRLRRAVCDMRAVPSISLTDERYRTYGGGNVSITVSDNGRVISVSQPDPTNKLYAGTFVDIIPTSSNAGATPPTFLVNIVEQTVSGNDVGVITLTITNAGKNNAQNDTLTFTPTKFYPGSPEGEFTCTISEISAPDTLLKTGGWTAVATVSCIFPTYIEIDIEKLGIPEGTTCTLNFDEGWFLEDRGRLLPSGAWEYPNATQGALSPEQPNYVTFRTPWYGLSFMNSAFTMPSLARFRFRPGIMNVNSAFTPIITAKVTRQGTDDMQTAFALNALLGIKKYFAVQMTSAFEGNEPGGLPFLIGNGYEYPPGSPFAYLNAPPPWQFPGVLRIRNSSIEISQIVSTLSLPEFLVVLEAAAVTNSNFTVSSDVFKYKGVVNLQFNSTTTQLSTGNRQARGVSTMTSSTSVSLPLIRRTKQFSANLSSPQATVFCDNNSPMILVFNTSLNRLNYVFGSAERTSVAGRTVMFSIGKFYQDYNDYQARGLRDKSANITVDWGDGTTSSHTNNLTLANLTVTTGGSGNITSTGSQAEVWHTYATPGIYEVKIYGTMKHFGGDLGSNPYLEVQDGNLQANIGPGETLIGCKTFGQQAGLTNLSGAFDSCYNLQYYPDIIPTTVTRLESVFDYAGTRVSGGPVGYNGSAGAANWNTINVITMGWLFRNTPMNPDISGWNVANVAPTAYTINDGFRAMFAGNTAFNRNLSGWCVNDFPTLPDGFDTGATAWVLPRPVWGTCP
jgi:hypothetical protein